MPTQSWIKAGKLMYLKGNAINGNRILSSNTGKAFQNIVAILKINSVDFWYFCFYM